MKRLSARQTGLLSLGFNLAYALFNGALAFLDRSWWLLTLCAYHTVLAVLRWAVLRWGPRDDRFLGRFCGGLLLFLALTLAGASYLAFLRDRGVVHHEIIVITMATYAFSKLTMALVRMIQSRRATSAVPRVLGSIALANGAASILSLQRTMLVSFRGMGANEIQLMNALTGTAVWLLVGWLGIRMMGGDKHGKDRRSDRKDG